MIVIGVVGPNSLSCATTTKVCSTNAISQQFLIKKLLSTTPFFEGRREKEGEEDITPFIQIISMC